MSLLTSTNAGSTSVNYFIENIGGPGSGVADAPCIKGSTLGTVLVGCGGPAKGLRLRGDTVANANAILGNQPNGGTLSIGNSVASPQNIVLTDGETDINGSFEVLNSIRAFANANPALATLDTYINRDIHGFSDTGYSDFTVVKVGGGAVPNPGALSIGLWSVIVVPEGAGNEAAQASATCYWDGAAWTGNGVSFNFTAGAPNLAICPVAGGATLNIGGAGIPGGNLNVRFRQLLAAPAL